MDYIKKVIKDKRRFLGFVEPKTKYQKRKEKTIFTFLFYMKKVKKIKKMNQFRYYHIQDFLIDLQKKENLAESTINEKEKILKAFFNRNKLDWNFNK
ncbi:hypothetical protein [Desulfothermus okinawensis]